MAKPNPKKHRSPEEIEKRNAVRYYTAQLLAVQLGKHRATRIPDEKQQRNIIGACIRMGLLAWKEEERILNQDEDSTARKQYQDESAA